jgi:hypothetical protein
MQSTLVLNNEQKLFLMDELDMTPSEIDWRCVHDIDFIATETMRILEEATKEDAHGNYDEQKADAVEEIMNKALNIVIGRIEDDKAIHFS